MHSTTDYEFLYVHAGVAMRVAMEHLRVVERMIGSGLLIVVEF